MESWYVSGMKTSSTRITPEARDQLEAARRFIQETGAAALPPELRSIYEARGGELTHSLLIEMGCEAILSLHRFQGTFRLSGELQQFLRSRGFTQEALQELNNLLNEFLPSFKEKAEEIRSRLTHRVAMIPHPVSAVDLSSERKDDSHE